MCLNWLDLWEFLISVEKLVTVGLCKFAPDQFLVFQIISDVVRSTSRCSVSWSQGFGGCLSKTTAEVTLICKVMSL